MVDSSQTDNAISWLEGGDGFTILDQNLLGETILP